MWGTKASVFHKSPNNKPEPLIGNNNLEMHFGTQIIARQPISNKQVAACVYEAHNFAYQPQSAASSRTSNTPSVLRAPQSSLSPGELGTWPQVSYSSQVCRRSAAPAWYARILSTVLAFYFSNTCYFTFKLGRHWRTEHLFCIPISSDEGGGVFASPLVKKKVLAYLCLCSL